MILSLLIALNVVLLFVNAYMLTKLKTLTNAIGDLKKKLLQLTLNVDEIINKSVSPPLTTRLNELRTKTFAVTSQQKFLRFKDKKDKDAK